MILFKDKVPESTFFIQDDSFYPTTVMVRAGGTIGVVGIGSTWTPNVSANIEKRTETEIQITEFIRTYFERAL